MTPARFFLGFFLLFGSLDGCVSLAEKRALQDQIGELDAQVEILRKRVESPGEVNTQNQQTLAELTSRMQQVQEEFAKVSARIDEIQHGVERSNTENEKILKDYDARLQDLSAQIAALKVTPASPLSKSSPPPEVEKENVAKKQPPPKPKTEEKSKTTEEEAYESAVALLTKSNPAEKDLTLAQKNLRNFIDTYPKSKLKTNAHYWLGEAYFRLKEYRPAIEQFDFVMKEKANAKVPGSLYKQGLCFLALEKPDTAKLFFQAVLDEYPQSQEAKLAQKKLSELGSSKGARGTTQHDLRKKRS